MNSSIATEIIELLCKKLGIVFEWTGEEIWPYIQQLMNELAVGKFWFHTTLAIVFACITIIIFIICRKIWDLDDCNCSAASITLGVFGGIPCTVGSIITTCYAVVWKTMPTIMAYKWIIEMLRT